MVDKRYKVELECGHALWLRPLPQVDEVLWCVKCDDEKRQTKADAHYATSYQDDWKSERKGKGYVGTCLSDSYDKAGNYNGQCNHTVKSSNWYALRNEIETHQLRDHTSLFRNLVITEAPRYASGSSAPF